MKSQSEECLEAEQAIFIVIGQAKERERSNFHSDGIVGNWTWQHDGDDDGDYYKLKNTWNSISIVWPDLTSGRKKQSSTPAATSTVIWGKGGSLTIKHNCLFLNDFKSPTCLCFDLALVPGEKNKQVIITANNMVAVPPIHKSFHSFRFTVSWRTMCVQKDQRVGPAAFCCVGTILNSWCKCCCSSAGVSRARFGASLLDPLNIPCNIKRMNDKQNNYKCPKSAALL